MRHSLHHGELALQIRLPARHHNHAFSSSAARAPKKVVLVAADGGREAVFGTEEIDGAGLSVVLSEDGGARADVGGQAVVNARHGGGHFLPPELIGKKLGQRSEPVSLDARWFEVGNLDRKSTRLNSRHL